MSIQTCFTRIKTYTKESGLEKNISEARLRDFAKMIEAAGGDSLTPAEFAARMQGLIEEDGERFYAKKKAELAITTLKRENAVQSIIGNTTQFKEDIAQGKTGVLFKTDKAPQMAAEAFRAWLEGGSLRAGTETNISVEKMSKAVLGDLYQTFNEAVKGVKDAAASGQLDKAMFQELDALDNHTELGKSGSHEALAYAKAIKVIRDKIFELKQANNPYLERASEYLLKQFHNRERVSATPKDQWVTDALQAFGDKSYMEQSLQEKVGTFGKIYDRIVSGDWGSQMDDFSKDFGEGNIMRRQAKSRQLVAKDWQASYDYFSKYGPKTAYEGLDKVMRGASRDISLLSKFGPTPEQTYEGVYRRVLSKLDGEDAEHFKSMKANFDAKFRVVSGSQNSPAQGHLARWSQSAMTLQYLSKTGAGTLRSLPDIALASSLIRDLNGRTIFENAASIASEYAKAMASSDYAKGRLEDLSLFAKAGHAELVRLLGSPENGPGGVSKLVEKMGSLNLLNRHVDAMRSATAVVLSKELGSTARYVWSDLPESWQQGLKRYGIAETEWELLRKSKGEVNGYTALTPEGVNALSDEAAEIYLRKTGQYDGEGAPSKQSLDYGRFQLSQKLSVMLNEHADLGSAHPDTRQRAFLWGDTNINQGWGLLRRLMTQFKSAALVTNDIYRRGYFSGTSPKGDYYGIAQHMAMGMFLWTLGEYASQLAAGKTPEDPSSPEFVTKTVVGSGAGGIFGDLLVGEMERQGVTDKALHMAKSILGPTLSTGIDTVSLLSQGLDQATGNGKSDRNLGSKAASLVLGNVPGQNLFYTKALFNYYFANGLHEFMGPGYLSHLERRTNQTPALGGGKQQYLFGRPRGQGFIE